MTSFWNLRCWSREHPEQRLTGQRSHAARAAVWLALALTLCSIFHAPLLTGLAGVWIIDQPVAKADAVLVLGGGLQYRAFEAARLYRTRLCEKILIVKVGLEPAQELGVMEAENLLIRRVLLKNGVPESAIVEVGNHSRNTWEDIESAKVWALQHGIRSLIVPTDLFHTRRVNWICRRLFRNTGINPCVTAIEPIDYHRDSWWRHEAGLISFQNEVIKLCFYFVKY